MTEIVEETFFLAFDVPDSVHHFYKEAGCLLEDKLEIIQLGGSISAHLTVKPTFKVPAPLARRLPGRLRAMVARKQIGSVAGYLAGIDHFDENVAHIPVNGEALRQTISCVLSEFASLGIERRENEGRRPHITVAKGFGRVQCPEVLKLLQTLEVPKGEATFRSLTLYQKTESSWRPVDQIVIDHSRVHT